MVKVLDKDGCEYDKKYTCYDCKYWRLVDPNCGGLIDVAVCARRLIEVTEDTNICIDFTAMDTRDQAVRDLVRTKMLEASEELQKNKKEYYRRELTEEVVDNVLETIKWGIMRRLNG